MFSTRTNPEAMLASRMFTANTTATADVFNRVGTGLKVPGAVEDASSFSIAQGVRGEVRAWQAVRQGLGGAVGVLKVAEAGATAISNLLNDLKEKYVQYFTADTQGQTIISNDITAILDQMDQMANQATFNGTNLINRDQAGLVVTPPPDEGTTFTFNGAGSNTHTLPAVPGTVTLSFTATGTGGGPLRLIYNGVNQDQEPINPPETGTLTFTYPATPATNFTVQKTGSPNTDIDYVFFFTPDANGGVEGEFRVLQDPENNEIDVQFRSMLTSDMSLRPPALSNIGAALAQIEAAEIEINQNLGYYGAKLRAVQQAIDHADRQTDANREGLGNIVDADLARDAAELTAAQAREELSRDVLGTVSRRSSVILGLFE